MRLRGSLFWGLVLIILAGLLLANQLGWLKGSIFDYFWPAVVILFGVWLVFGAISSRQHAGEAQNISIPLENAKSARIKLDHGAGRLTLKSGASPAELLSGVFTSEVEYHSHLEGDQMQVKLRTAPHFWAWYPGQTLDWKISLNNEMPLKLKIDSGASTSVLDLTDLKVSDLDIDTGASTTEVTLPAAAGYTNVDIDTGASTVKIHIPAGVAARIHVKTGVAAVNVDSTRFPRLDNGIYQSADYAGAANRADIAVDAGVGSIDIN